MPVWMDGKKVDDATEQELSALAAIIAQQKETNRLLKAMILGLMPLAPDLASVES